VCREMHALQAAGQHVGGCNGMLDTAIWPAGTVAVSSNTALRPGSSHEGTKRRASEFSN